MSEAVLSPLIVLVGSPNCGKTALFNALTGSQQKVANYAGVTVEKKEGLVESRTGFKFRLLDLPGAYSLNPHTPDQMITRDVLLSRMTEVGTPEVLVAVADATNLERTLNLVLELNTLGQPIVLALNMMDLANQRNLKLDLGKLQAELKMPVVPTVAVKGKGLPELSQEIEKAYLQKSNQKIASSWRESSAEEVRARFREIDRILKISVIQSQQPAYWTQKIDQVVLNPFLAYPILLGVLALVFQAIFSWASFPQDWIEGFLSALGQWVGASLSPGPLNSLIVDGIIAGVGAVVVFLPQILLLFLFILLLEDSGYMARAAFLMDRLMGKVGLDGKAFIPLLSSYACAIPGILSTRTIENRRDRLTTILVAPLTTCSARLPVYTLLIGAFIPNNSVWGPLHLRGLVLLGLYFLGVLSVFLMAFLIRKTVLKGPHPSLIMELPTYKVPSFRSLAIGLLERAKVFLKRAGTFILSFSILLWFLSSYPKPPEGASEPAIHYSFAGKLGHAIEPVFKPIGFDWRISTSLIPGFAAREVMVGSLATVLAIENQDGDESVLSEALGRQLSQVWSLATALSLLVWYVFAPQCLSTFAVTRRETNSVGWTLFMFVYLLALAYFASFVVFQAATALGWGLI